MVRAARSFSARVLFPETPAEVLRSPASRGADAPGSSVLEQAEPAPVVGGGPLSPVAQEVLKVSSAMFAERGYYSVGMEEIAAAADVSRATLYRYFSTKDKILAELARDFVTRREFNELTGRLDGLQAILGQARGKDTDTPVPG